MLKLIMKMSLSWMKAAIAVVGVLLTAAAIASSADYREVTWDDLMPPGWEPPIPEVPDDYSDPGGYSDPGDYADPGDFAEGDTFSLPVQEPAPIVTSLANQKLRLPGYVIPVKFDAQGVTEFLLVPYVGACIHVPPPPENQIVYVTLKEPLVTDDLWMPVWVNGTMTIGSQQTQYATAGYHMKGAETEIYVLEE